MIDGDVDGHSCPGRGGRTHPQLNLIIKKLKSARETGELETEGENAKNHLLNEFLDLILTCQTII